MNQTSPAVGVALPLAVESFSPTSWDGPQFANRSVGDGRMTEGLKEDSGAWRRGLVVEYQKQTAKPEGARSAQDSSAPDGEEEFFDPDEYSGEDSEKVFPALPVDTDSVGRPELRRTDHAVADGAEVPLSPPEAMPGFEKSGVHGEDQLVKGGNGEASAAIKEELQAQQGWVWSLLQRLGCAGGRAVTVVDSDLNPDLFDAEFSGNSDTANVVAPKASGSGAPRASASAKTAAEKSEARIREITAKIEIAFAKLNQQLIEKYQIPELALARKAGSVNVPLTFWDNLGRMGHRMYGAGSAGLGAVGQVAVGAAIPSVVDMLPAGITTRIAATAGGVWLSLRAALAGLPDQAKSIAALAHVDAELAAVRPMLDELRGLVEQEKQRVAGGAKTMMVSLEREQRINELERERNLLENALAHAASGSMGKAEFLEHPVALGSGEARAQTLNERQLGQSAFQSFFVSIGEIWSSFIGLLTYLPNIFSNNAAYRDAARREEAYLEAYRDAFSTLSIRAKNSGIDLLADPVTRMMQDGYGDDEIDRRHKEVGAQLYRGENLQRLVSGADQVAFGQVSVASMATPDIKTLVPASLSMARDMASYFSLMADKDADDQGFEVVRNEDGSLSVDDPKGQLYSFLMSVASAYTSGMAGVTGGGALAGLTIDDHSAGFPGGCRSMRFERALKLDSSGNPIANEQGGFVGSLRVAFLTEPSQPIYAPLANEGLALRSVAVRKHIAERKSGGASLTEIEAAAAKKYAHMEPEGLEARLEQVNRDIERNLALLQVEQGQFKALQNWNAQL